MGISILACRKDGYETLIYIKKNRSASRDLIVWADEMPNEEMTYQWKATYMFKSPMFI